MTDLNSDSGDKHWVRHLEKNQQNSKKLSSISTKKELEFFYPNSAGYSLLLCMYVYS